MDSRVEEILESTINDTSVTITPQSRIEKLLIELKTAISVGESDGVTSEEIKTLLEEYLTNGDYAKIEDIPTNVSAFTNDSGYLTEHQNLDSYSTTTEMDLAISAATTDMATNTSVDTKLTNYSTTNEVVSKIAEEIAKIVADSPDSFDTLKEIADWIENHTDSASAMNSAINTNTNAITELQNGKVDISDLAAVATSGSYSDLTNKPTSMTADGGNADTVDGKHASDLMQYKGFVSDLFAVNETCFCVYNSQTLNTPYSEGISTSSVGLVIINYAAGSEYVTYTVYPSGEAAVYTATSANGVKTSGWKRVSDRGNAATAEYLTLFYSKDYPSEDYIIFYPNYMTGLVNGDSCYKLFVSLLNEYGRPVLSLIGYIYIYVEDSGDISTNIYTVFSNQYAETTIEKRDDSDDGNERGYTISYDTSVYSKCSLKVIKEF